jgi:hypothetical protein
MSILADVFNYGGKLQKEPTYLERKYNEESSLARTQRKSKEGADAIRTTEADLRVAWKAKIGAAEGAELERLNAVDIDNPTISDYITVYGYEKGGEIATRNTTIANAMLGDSDQFKKDFDWSLSKPILDESGKFTGQIDLPVRYTDLKTGESYTADFTTSGEKTSKVFQEQGQEGLDADKRTFDVAELDEGYLLTRDAIFRQGGYDTSVSRLQGANQDIDNGIYTEAGVRKAFFDQLDAQVPTEGAEGADTLSPNVPLEQTEDMATTSAALTSQDVFNGVGRSEKTSSANINKLIKSGYIYQGGIPFGMTPEKWKAEYNTKGKRAIAYKKAEQYNELALSTIVGEGLSPFFGPIDYIKQLGKPQSEEEEQKFASVKNIYSTKLNEENLKAAFTKDPSKIAEFQADPLAFALKYENANLEGNDIDRKEGQNLVKQMNKEFDFSQAKVDALKTAMTNRNQEDIVAAANAITNGEAPSNEVQTQIVNILTKAKSNIKLRGINKRINNRIVLGIIASDPQLLANNMDTITSFAQTGLLDISAATAQANAQVGMINAQRQSKSPFLSSINSISIRNDDNSLVSKDSDALSQLVSFGVQATAQNDQEGMLAYEVKASQWIKGWLEQNSKVSFWSTLLSLGQAGAPSSEAFSISPHIKYVPRVPGGAGAKFVLLNADGSESSAFIDAYVAQNQLGPSGYEILLAAAKGSKKRNAN